MERSHIIFILQLDSQCRAAIATPRRKEPVISDLINATHCPSTALSGIPWSVSCSAIDGAHSWQQHAAAATAAVGQMQHQAQTAAGNFAGGGPGAPGLQPPGADSRCSQGTGPIKEWEMEVRHRPAWHAGTTNCRVSWCRGSVRLPTSCMPCKGTCLVMSPFHEQTAAAWTSSTWSSPVHQGRSMPARTPHPSIVALQQVLHCPAAGTSNTVRPISIQVSLFSLRRHRATCATVSPAVAAGGGRRLMGQ